MFEREEFFMKLKKGCWGRAFFSLEDLTGFPWHGRDYPLSREALGRNPAHRNGIEICPRYPNGL